MLLLHDYRCSKYSVVHLPHFLSDVTLTSLQPLPGDSEKGPVEMVTVGGEPTPVYKSNPDSKPHITVENGHSNAAFVVDPSGSKEDTAKSAI